MFLASQLQTRNKIQSFKLTKPSPELAEILCTRCDAKVVFVLRRCADDSNSNNNNEQRYRMSR